MRRDTLQQSEKSKEPPCACSYCCSRRGESIVIKRGVQPRINEAELMGSIGEQYAKAMSATTNEILKRAKEMGAPMIEGEAATMNTGPKWWRLFKAATKR